MPGDHPIDPRTVLTIGLLGSMWAAIILIVLDRHQLAALACLSMAGFAAAFGHRLFSDPDGRGADGG